MSFRHAAARIGGAFALLCFAGASFAAVPLQASVEPVLDKAAQGTGQVRYTLTNTSDRAVVLLKWQTPLEGISEDLFSVRHNGKEVLYIGKHVKRAAPRAADFMVLGAGESDSVVVDLTQAYAMYEPGAYEVSVDAHLDDVFVERADAKVARAGEVELESASYTLMIDAAHVAQMPDLSYLSAKAISFQSCSSSRQSALSTAHGSARSYASNSKSYLDAGSRGARYTTWFGTYSSSRYATVRDHFTKILDAINNKPIVYNCSCTDSYYAYVYPTQPYKIYLCNAFWSAPNTGTDSRAGTIVHELSHFNVLGGTDDHAYGQTAAKNLARSNPNRAVDNADNHEYFAENTPFQN